MELWKLNTIFKLFLLSVTGAFLVSAFLHQIVILHVLPIVLAAGASGYVAVIVEPVLHRKQFRTYVLGLTLLMLGLVAVIASVGYIATASLIDSCPSSTGTILDWSGNFTLSLDVERHPFLDSGTSYIFRFERLSGPGYSYRISQDPLPTPVLHRGSLSAVSNVDVWTFTPTECGKYWIELTTTSFARPNGYHVILTSLT